MVNYFLAVQTIIHKKTNVIVKKYSYFIYMKSNSKSNSVYRLRI